MQPNPTPVVIKVGGSLFDLPDLAARLRDFVRRLAAPEVLLVPGGGPAADVVRRLDACHALGQEAAHWLALRALTVNAHFLAVLCLPRPVVAGTCDEIRDGLRADGTAVLDAFRFMEADEGRPGALPHTWDVTSDSVAARVAGVAGARRLCLLKSAPLPPGLDWRDAGRRGLVDRAFADVLTAAPQLSVRWVNLREGSQGKLGT
jgi:aspartokinase-like uncharacterized kinase